MGPDLETSTGSTTRPAPDPDRDARIRRLTREHVFSSWAAQGAVEPVPIAGGEGARFWDHTGRTWIDFTSQLVNANLGYRHPRLIEAIREASEDILTVSPAFAHEARAEAAAAIAEVAPGDLSTVFFTTGGAEAVEHAVRMARAATGRHKILSAYRSYHGATAAALTLTGENRRWGAEPGIPGVVRFWGPYLYRSAFHATTPEQESARALQHLRDTVTMEGPHTVAAIVLEPVVGSAGILVPPPGYLAGVREICDEFGILLVADEVMAGFGRCGEWFAIDRWDVVPDLITFAKGVNSGYLPLGGVVMSPAVAGAFAERPYPGGSTYSGHPFACASAVASICIMREERVLERTRALGEDVLGPALQGLAERHEAVGEVRGIGAFWAVELVKDQDTREPLVPYAAGGAAAKPVADVVAACVRRGMWPLAMGNRIHVVPPCVIGQADAEAGVAILDEALSEVLG